MRFPISLFFMSLCLTGKIVGKMFPTIKIESKKTIEKFSVSNKSN